MQFFNRYTKHTSFRDFELKELRKVLIIQFSISLINISQDYSFHVEKGKSTENTFLVALPSKAL